MYLSIFTGEEPEGAEPLSIDPTSLYSAFVQVKDGRGKKGKRYPLPLVLTLLMLGKLAGETTVSGVVDWVRERQGWLRRQFDWPKRFPTNSTYSDALAVCDTEQLVKVIAGVLLKARADAQQNSLPATHGQEEPADELTHVAMDGKTLRGTLGHNKAGQPSVHLLALYECQSGIVLSHRAVQSKENEISAAAALVHPALVKGRILSTDAMHTQKKWCACVHCYGGYYLTIVKKNQPQLYEDLAAFFLDPDAEQGEWQYAKKVQKSHGRLEVRELWRSTRMNAWCETEWAGIAQVFRIRRTVTGRRPTKEEEPDPDDWVYGVTNLPRKRANAARLLALQQEHWHIENRLHWRRDVTLGEDRSQVRIAGAPQALAALNGGVLALMDWLQVPNVASQMRHFCAHPADALQLLCGALLRHNG